MIQAGEGGLEGGHKLALQDGLDLRNVKHKVNPEIARQCQLNRDRVKDPDHRKRANKPGRQLLDPQ